MTDFSTSTLRLAVSQHAPRYGMVSENAARIRELARTCDADLLLTPELCLTGYDVRDLVHELARSPQQVSRQLMLASEIAVAVGFIESSETAVPYNSAAVFQRDQVLLLHRKLYLPTYGMFDEARYFGRGEQVHALSWRGWRFGLLICEDFWHPALTYLLACQRIDALLVMAAAPGRGVWSGGQHSDFASNDAWECIGRAVALQYGIYVVLCNRVGVEGGVTFGGGSFVVLPNSEIAGRAENGEQLLRFELHREEIERSRRPYAHIRDESPGLVNRELQRILSA